VRIVQKSNEPVLVRFQCAGWTTLFIHGLKTVTIILANIRRKTTTELYGTLVGIVTKGVTKWSGE